mmetsp:Transcript_5486/g.7334  ORF Transcript_5486/g.7334 Transcript_5486/m.7334 type:complete len:119 (-) Transcript_5486:368-724(-)
MKQWKNKLFNEDNNGAAGAPNADGLNDDAVSSYSAAKSNYSRGSRQSDSPFLQISRQQTQSLLKGNPQNKTNQQVIPEEYEDSQDSDGVDGVILTKQERRRLNQLSMRSEVKGSASKV